MQAKDLLKNPEIVREWLETSDKELLPQTQLALARAFLEIHEQTRWRKWPEEKPEIGCWCVIWDGLDYILSGYRTSKEEWIYEVDNQIKTVDSTDTFYYKLLTPPET